MGLCDMRGPDDAIRMMIMKTKRGGLGTCGLIACIHG